MRHYSVWKHPYLPPKAVKTGTSWPGFFFTWIWAAVKGLWAQAAIIVLLLLAFWLMQSYAALQPPDAKAGISILGWILSWSISIVCAVKGNQWRTDKLMSQGYEKVLDVAAPSANAALAVFAR